MQRNTAALFASMPGCLLLSGSHDLCGRRAVEARRTAIEVSRRRIYFQYPRHLTFARKNRFLCTCRSVMNNQFISPKDRAPYQILRCRKTIQRKIFTEECRGQIFSNANSRRDRRSWKGANPISNHCWWHEEYPPRYFGIGRRTYFGELGSLGTLHFWL